MRKLVKCCLVLLKKLTEVKAIVESFVGFGILVTQGKLRLQKSGLAGHCSKSNTIMNA